METNNQTDADTFFQSLPADIREQLPVALGHVKQIGAGFIRVDSSAYYHTDKMACYWFYKPVSQMYKTFDE